MLPALASLNLLDITPDLSDIDIWDNLDISIIPDSPGCYAFYEALTGDVVYIGCATSQSPVENERWLRIRIRHYTGTRSKSTFKVRQEHCSGNRLLFKCWVTATESDALKYEWDAIRQYSPRLNHIGKSVRTLQEYKEAKRKSGKILTDRYFSINDYDPSRNIRCFACGAWKESRLFSKNKFKKHGVNRCCKLCRVLNHNRGKNYIFPRLIVDGVMHGHAISVVSLSPNTIVCLRRDTDSEMTRISLNNGRHSLGRTKYQIKSIGKDLTVESIISHRTC